MANILTITLAGDKKVEMAAPCYVLQAYNGGKWINLEVYPVTREGLIEAERGYKKYQYPDMRVEMFN